MTLFRLLLPSLTRVIWPLPACTFSLKVSVRLEPVATLPPLSCGVLLESTGAVLSTVRPVLMVEHHIDVVTGLAERIAVMHHGSLLACDTPAAVMANPTVQSAYLGEEL